MLQIINNDFAIFRDDCYPLLGGGNKARKMMALHEKLKKENYNAIVTTGGIQSNHCRATAVYCHIENIDCTLVIHGNKNDFLIESGNAKIIRNTPSNIVFSETNGISNDMNTAMDTYKNQGANPFYLHGGGHTLEGAKAYIDVIQEMVKSNFIPDYIFIPSGTGSTHAGVLTGIAKFNLKTKVIGISVGRTKNNAEKVIDSFTKELANKYKIINKIGEIIVDDSYLCGGYGKFNNEIENISNNSLINYNIFLDSTYTGKTFYGMKKHIKQNNLKGKILFWYTGGIFNYLAK